MRQARRWIALSFAAAALCVATPPRGLAAGDGCTPIPGGDFEHGLAGWIVETVDEGFGHHDGVALASVVDLTAFGGDANVARLELASEATGGGSMHESRVSIRRHATVTGGFLEVETGGAYEVVLFGSGGMSLRSEIAVRGARAELRLPLILDRSRASYFCGHGAQGLGVQPAGIQSYDLAGAGFEVGDVVEIEVIWTATAVAPGACDVASVTGTLEVDGFAFCDGPTSPGGGG